MRRHCIARHEIRTKLLLAVVCPFGYALHAELPYASSPLTLYWHGMQKKGQRGLMNPPLLVGLWTKDFLLADIGDDLPALGAAQRVSTEVCAQHHTCFLC